MISSLLLLWPWQSGDLMPYALISPPKLQLLGQMSLSKVFWGPHNGANSFARSSYRITHLRRSLRIQALFPVHWVEFVSIPASESPQKFSLIRRDWWKDRKAEGSLETQGCHLCLSVSLFLSLYVSVSLSLSVSGSLSFPLAPQTQHTWWGGSRTCLVLRQPWGEPATNLPRFARSPASTLGELLCAGFFELCFITDHL